MRLRILGPLEVERDGGSHTFGPKQGALLALLAVHNGEALNVDTIVDLLWPDSDLDKARGSLRYHVSHIRKTLGDRGAPVIETVGPAYRIGDAFAGIDSVEFERAVSEAEASADSDAAGTVQTLDAALALWRGPALSDFRYEEFAQLAITRLDALHLAARELRLTCLLDTGGHRAVLPELEVLTRAHPLHEGFWALLMLARYRAGQQADALGAYQRARRLLGEQLGIEPGQSLRALEERILLQDPGLTLRPGRESAAVVSASPATVLAIRLSGTSDWEVSASSALDAVTTFHEMTVLAVESAGGHVVSRSTSGLVAGLDTADAALGAVTALQHAIASHEWPDVPLGVRAAIHVTSEVSRTGDLAEPSIAVANLLAEMAREGETLLTEQAVADLGGVPETMTSTRLEPVALPGELGTVTPWVLRDGAAPDQPERTRPLTNLPSPATTFVGRVGELETVRRLIRQHRIVTLSGVGGTGKTRLAVEAARPMARAFRDGVWFVDLTRLGAADSVATSAARALGLRDQPGRDPEAALIDHMATREMLLILDNCEHVLDQASKLVSTIASAASSVTVLATSRRMLGCPGEARWRIPPLGLPATTDGGSSDATRLFVERASLVDPAIGGDTGLQATIAEICRKLDGVPLAIELAAARLATMSLDDLAVRLSADIGVLGAASGGVPERQRTLDATIDWSYRLLDPNARSLLDILSTFAGGFTPEAAEALYRELNDDAATGTIHLLGSLMDASLVEIDDGDPPRHRLMETVRQFAAKRLDEAQSAAARRAHVAFFAARSVGDGRTLMTQPDHVKSITADLPNYRAAMRNALAEGDGTHAGTIAAALDFYWLWTGRAREGRRWALDAARRLSPDTTGSRPGSTEAMPGEVLRATLERTIGFLAAIDRDYSAAEQYLDGSARRFGSILDAIPADPTDRATRALQAAATRGRAWSHFHRARMVTAQVFGGSLPVALASEASATYQRSIDTFRDAGYEIDLAHALPFAGWNEVVARSGRGEEVLAEARRLANRLGLRWPEAVATANLGLAEAIRGEFTSALSHLTSAAGVFRRMQDLYSLQVVVTSAGVAALGCDEQRIARDSAVEACRLMAVQGDREWEAMTGGLTLTVLVDEGHDEVARAIGAWLESTNPSWPRLLRSLGLPEGAERHPVPGPSPEVQTPADATDAARLALSTLDR